MDVKTDNRLCNLELVTASENSKHAYVMGLSRADGEHNGRSLLDWDKVRSIRSRPKESRAALAAEYGVSPRTIRDVIYYTTWKELP